MCGGFSPCALELRLSPLLVSLLISPVAPYPLDSLLVTQLAIVSHESLSAGLAHCRHESLSAGLVAVILSQP